VDADLVARVGQEYVADARLVLAALIEANDDPNGHDHG
jgi:hypothetical protein